MGLYALIGPAKSSADSRPSVLHLLLEAGLGAGLGLVLRICILAARHVCAATAIGVHGLHSSFHVA